jgi:TPP-dependent pyruvate/acetoin dehydrogenase alpha subunit
MDILKIYRTMLLIRRFEEKIEEYFSKGILRGTTHGSIGQEIIPSTLIELVNKEEDYIFATHRGHGYFLAYAQDPFLLASEMMGKATGPVFGGGGSQHIKYHHFYTNGITGGMTPIAVGAALQLKREQKIGMAICILGDGGFNEGYVQEAFNLASVWSVPILFIMENNKYAMSTRSSDFTAGSMQERIRSYHIAYKAIDTVDIDMFYTALRQGVEQVRTKQEPFFIEIDTFRFCGHSKSDDCGYMNIKEKEYYILADPLAAIASQIPTKDHKKISSEIDKIITAAFIKAKESLEIDVSEFSDLRKGIKQHET